MNFNTYFRLASYATVAAAALALFATGGFSLWLLLAFAAAMACAWKLEGSRWQLTERVALLVIVLSLPVFYFDWRVITPILSDVSQAGRTRINAEIGVLAHLILFLSAVKLLQTKADRDWFFLYLISFFQVLLAAA